MAIDTENSPSLQRTVVLLSGGIDSTAVLHYYLQNDHKTEGLFIDYGQRAIDHEHIAATRVASYYGIALHEATLRPNVSIGSGEILGRNLALLTIAFMKFDQKNGFIAIGTHAGTPYSDSSNPFLKSVQAVFDQYRDGLVQVVAPFIELSKREVWQYCMDNKVPIELTYSCELGKIQPCGQCLSCKDLESLYEIS